MSTKLGTCSLSHAQHASYPAHLIMCRRGKCEQLSFHSNHLALFNSNISTLFIVLHTSLLLADDVCVCLCICDCVSVSVCLCVYICLCVPVPVPVTVPVPVSIFLHLSCTQPPTLLAGVTFFPNPMQVDFSVGKRTLVAVRREVERAHSRYGTLQETEPCMKMCAMSQVRCAI